jgi:magnesium chelatase subunit I
LGIDSLRAEITWFEAARACAAADNRSEVTQEDLQTVAPMALRLRRSIFIKEYFDNQAAEEEELMALAAGFARKKKARPI